MKAMPTLAEQFRIAFARRKKIERYSRIMAAEFHRVRYGNEFIESEHPRDGDGKFAEKGGQSASGTQEGRPQRRTYPSDFAKYKKRSARMNAAHVFSQQQTKDSGVPLSKEYASSVRQGIIAVCGNMNSFAFHGLMQMVHKVSFEKSQNYSGKWELFANKVTINAELESDFEIEGTIAHEFAHAIDVHPETRQRISDTPEWEKAFDDEIDRDGDPLSEYARTEPAEGFAEFCRLVWTTGYKERARKLFPKCWGVLKNHGLVGTS